MGLVIRAASSEDQNRFSTYLNYLESICDYIYDEYGDSDNGDSDNLGSVIVKSAKTFKLSSDLDHTKLEKWLKLSWNNEYLLYVNCEGKDEEVLRFTNPWIPVLTYYSIYSCLVAFCYSYDKSTPKTHGGTLRKVTSLLVDKGIPPWNLAYQGPPGRKDQDHIPVNFPNDIDWKNLPSNLQKYKRRPIAVIAKCLRAEHKHRKEDIWQSNHNGKKYTEFKEEVHHLGG